MELAIPEIHRKDLIIKALVRSRATILATFNGSLNCWRDVDAEIREAIDLRIRELADGEAMAVPETTHGRMSRCRCRDLGDDGTHAPGCEPAAVDRLPAPSRAGSLED